jgi:hypothetical protein
VLHQRQNNEGMSYRSDRRKDNGLVRGLVTSGLHVIYLTKNECDHETAHKSPICVLLLVVWPSNTPSEI